MIHENVSLKDDGFQIWESDETISDFSTDPVTDLLLAASELTESATLVFYPLACAVQAAVRTGIREIHPLEVHSSTYGPDRDLPTFLTACEEVREETDAQVADLKSKTWIPEPDPAGNRVVFYDRKLVAKTASLNVASSGHVGTKGSAKCICDSSEETRAIYLQNEYNVPRYNDYEWDVLKAAREYYKSLPKNIRDIWLDARGTLQRAILEDHAFILRAEYTEESCPSNRHYFGIELERLLEGAPEVAAPAAKIRNILPYNGKDVRGDRDWGTMHYEIVDSRIVEDIEIVDFGTKYRAKSDSAFTQSESWETYEFESYRAPITAGTPWDDKHGYIVPESYEMNPLSFSYLEAQVDAEYDRRKKRGDVWLSPKRGERHTWKFTSSRGSMGGRTKGWSPFYAFQQTQRRRAAARRKELIATLVDAIGFQMEDPRIQARIREIGEDATLTALQELTQTKVQVIV